MHRLSLPYKLDGRDFVRPARLIDVGDNRDGDLPDLTKPGTQGCFLAMIAETNNRRSPHDALRGVAHAMGRGLCIEEALVFVLEHSHEDWQPAL